jgi:hypothetical protein
MLIEANEKQTKESCLALYQNVEHASCVKKKTGIPIYHGESWLTCTQDVTCSNLGRYTSYAV